MMTERFLALIVFLWAPQILSVSAWAQGQGSPVVIGESVQLQSSTLKESRSLLISKPAGYDNSTDRYPVLYLLDGETHFHYASGIASFLAENDRMPKMLLVGIVSGGRVRRTHDLTTPSAVEMDNRFSPGNGGADAFLSFIADELIPFVDKTYRTRPYRLLMGHSIGGLFGVYALVTKPTLFNAYIVADPSLYWNNEAVGARAESFFSSTKSLQADFYMTTSSMTAASASDEVPSAVARLNAALGKKAPAGFRWNFDWMKQEDHLSIPLPSIYRGLETIFEDWRLTDPVALFDKGGIEGIHRRDREAGQRFGYPERITSPFTVSLVVAALLRAGRLEEASGVLLHDPKAYPPPWNQLDALARAYENRGDAEQAARYYLLSLRQNPGNEFARKKLTEMGTKIPELPRD
jgi:predicted alpha/beta superfamily hydrolase